MYTEKKETHKDMCPRRMYSISDYVFGLPGKSVYL